MMLLLEAATVLTGWLMGINPLDQPAVELGKRLANTRLGASGHPREAADLAAYLKRAAMNQAPRFRPIPLQGRLSCRILIFRYWTDRTI